MYERNSNAWAKRRQKGGRALSLLTSYINRAGRHPPQSRKRVLERAKGELLGSI